jgi:hypothetical protein
MGNGHALPSRHGASEIRVLPSKAGSPTGRGDRRAAVPVEVRARRAPRGWAWAGAPALAAVLLLGASPASASHGGPDVARALGWDPIDRKVFFSISSLDESGYAPAVIYFRLDDSTRVEPVRVGWSEGRSMEDSTHAAELRKLEDRLRPLREIAGPTVFSYVKILARDSTGGAYNLERFRVEVFDPGVCSDRFEVTTVVSEAVSLIRLFEVLEGGPPRSRFGILVFRGKPYETGYEVQVPVRLTGGAHRVEWKSWE